MQLGNVARRRVFPLSPVDVGALADAAWLYNFRFVKQLRAYRKLLPADLLSVMASNPFVYCMTDVCTAHLCDHHGRRHQSRLPHALPRHEVRFGEKTCQDLSYKTPGPF